MADGHTAVAQTCLAMALTGAHRHGFHLFPVRRDGKQPAQRASWKTIATRDLNQIRRWFGGPGRYNIGVATGLSGLVVVDLDVAHGEPAPERWASAQSGLDVFLALAADAQADPSLDTYTVRTPSGGLHLYFRAPAGRALRTTIGTLGWRIDTRAEGGYVVGAGSRRPQGHYVLEDEAAPIRPLPAWLAGALTSPPPLPPVARGGRELSSVRRTAYVQAILTLEANSVAGAPVGQRHRTLLRAARIFGELVGGRHLDEQDARRALLDAAEPHIGVADCTEREVTKTIDDGLAYGQRRPRIISAGSVRGA